MRLYWFLQFMSSPHEVRAFEVFDSYSKHHHGWFVAEMFPSEDKTEFVLCFRPLDTGADASNRYVCKYLRIPTPVMKAVAQEMKISTDISDRLDRELGRARDS